MLTIDQLTKRFYNIVALDGITFQLKRGGVIGVLGPNGAGKSTLFRIIAGVLNPDGGHVHASGRGWPAIGYKPERLLFPGHLRVEAYLQTTAALSDLPGGQRQTAVSNALAQVGLTSAARQPIKDCSKGMRQRLALAQAIMGQPQLLLLDEPWNGLDPDGQQDIQNLVRGLHAAGTTILISSHRLHELTEICTDLIILNRGQIHYENSMATALAMQPHAILTLDRDATPLQSLLLTIHPNIEIQGERVRLTNGAVQQRRRVMVVLLSAGYDILNVSQQRTTLHDIYAEATR